MGTSGIFPTPPWPVIPGTDYGTCLSCFIRPVSLPMPNGTTYSASIFDLAPDSSTVSGRQCLSEALARRLVTTRGTLVGCPDYGTDLRDYVNADLGVRDLALIAAAVEAECLKDERCLRATALVTLVAGILIVAISIVDGAGPFKLVLSVSAVTVSVLQAG